MKTPCRSDYDGAFFVILVSELYLSV